MEEVEVNPDISEFIVFSGGGGLINRKADVSFPKGETRVRIRGVPASFDPETFLVEIDAKKLELQEIIIKKPNRQYVEDNLRREATTANRLIQDSVEIGERRKEIIEICEEVSLRTYLDEEVYVLVRVKAKSPVKSSLLISYFIDDARFKWKPTVTVEVSDGESVRIQGFIAITNDSARLFKGIEVSFAEFTKDMKEDAGFAQIEPRALRAMMTKQAMNVAHFK
jgi:hypothetical protein